MAVDWAKLYENGRCKEIGISWSEEELNARYTLKIPAEFVRQGCLTQKAYDKMRGKVEGDTKTTGEKPLVYMNTKELLMLKEASDLGLTKEVPRTTIISMISEYRKNNSEPEKSLEKEQINSDPVMPVPDEGGEERQD